MDVLLTAGGVACASLPGGALVSARCSVAWKLQLDVLSKWFFVKLRQRGGMHGFDVFCRLALILQRLAWKVVCSGFVFVEGPGSDSWHSHFSHTTRGSSVWADGVRLRYDVFCPHSKQGGQRPTRRCSCKV